MGAIRKWWVRLIISVITVAIGLEIYHLLTGKELGAMGFLIMMALYLALNVIYGLHLRKKDKQMGT